LKNKLKKKSMPK